MMQSAFALCTIKGGRVPQDAEHGIKANGTCMLTADQLRAIALQRLDDAKILFDANSFDGAVYICGYSVELGLKAKICTTPWWTGYPSSSAEFDDIAKSLKNMKSHNLPALLTLSWAETLIKQVNLTEEKHHELVRWVYRRR